MTSLAAALGENSFAQTAEDVTKLGNEEDSRRTLIRRHLWRYMERDI
jgi:hypothetical protein